MYLYGMYLKYNFFDRKSVNVNLSLLLLNSSLECLFVLLF